MRPTEPTPTNGWVDAFPVGELPVVITFIYIALIFQDPPKDEHNEIRKMKV